MKNYVFFLTGYKRNELPILRKLLIHTIQYAPKLKQKMVPKVDKANRISK